MSPFSSFAILYMAALVLELADRWRYPLVTLAALLLLPAVLYVGVTRVTFFAFLAFVTLHFIIGPFPDVANHVNLEIYANVVLMLGIGYSVARRRDYPRDDDVLELVRPVLQVSLILVYATAGFHKLNSDFFNPRVSCAGDMAARLVRDSEIGLPPGLLLVAAAVLGVNQLSSLHPAGRRWSVPMRLGVMAAVLTAAAAGFLAWPLLPDPLFYATVIGLALLVIGWELIGGLLLAVARLQAPLLALCWTMHAALALVGFVDFGALALALLFTFVPEPYQRVVDGYERVPWLGRQVRRTHVYVGLCILSGLLSGLNRRFLAGVVFNGAALVLLAPLLGALLSRDGPAWKGVPVTGRRTPGWLWLFPVVLVLFGSTSYLGLRTAGNFSMYSNLKTEGPRSNHLLLGGNPLKVWGYQEDVVRILRFDNRLETSNLAPLEGKWVPMVEFRKLIHQWTAAGKQVPISFMYRGEVYESDDIVTDPVWRSRGRTWEMWLLDFRGIQPLGSNLCRW